MKLQKAFGYHDKSHKLTNNPQFLEGELVCIEEVMHTYSKCVSLFLKLAFRVKKYLLRNNLLVLLI